MDSGSLKDLLTVYIPTYNRRESLYRTLLHLSLQTNQEFEIVISDNNSDYDLTTILTEFSTAFLERCTLIRRRVNVGADYNILDAFSACRTRWVWTLADDDIIRFDAIEKIYKHIKNVGFFGCVDISLCKDMPIKNGEEVRLASIEQFNSYYNTAYREQTKWHDDLIFLSNKIYDVIEMREVLPIVYKYAYSGISTVILYMKMLEKGIPLFIVSDDIVRYGTDEKQSWNFGEVVLRSRVIRDVNFDLSSLEYKYMLRNISFNIWTVFFRIFSLEKGVNRLFFSTIYQDYYRYFLPFQQKCLLYLIAWLYRKGITRKMLVYFMRKKMKIHINS